MSNGESKMIEKAPKPEWEKVNDSTERMKIPGGWMVRSVFQRGSITTRNGIFPATERSEISFIPDENHKWKIGESNA